MKKADMKLSGNAEICHKGSGCKQEGENPSFFLTSNPYLVSSVAESVRKT